MSDPFWFVWNPAGRAPQFKHPSVTSALNEAERLARLNPGNEFIVLQTVCAMKITDLQITNLRSNIDDIPF